MKIINIKRFNRHMYDYLDDLPIMVINTRKKKKIFMVVSPDYERVVEVVEGGGKK